MAVTRTFAGTLLIDPDFRQVLSGDARGGPSLEELKFLQTWDNDGGDDPHLSGWLYGTLSVGASGDIELANASDPFGSFGDAVHSDGLTVAGKKLKLLYLRADSANTQNVTVTRKATVGLPVLNADGDQFTLTPGGLFLWVDPAGDKIGALTNDANDVLTLAPVSGTQTLYLLAVYGS
jgi:hypothetical protein